MAALISQRFNCNQLTFFFNFTIEKNFKFSEVFPIFTKINFWYVNQNSMFQSSTVYGVVKGNVKFYNLLSDFKFLSYVIFMGLLVGFYFPVRLLKSYSRLEGFGSNTISKLCVPMQASSCYPASAPSE
ncbi:hypothetical protein BpHYR1_025934 [Brachionus plicatilis]|uniref:Uncharacterized protein n=1 Tax=Brachionus plicatilis TaxID=10195 RepID=A0A3M7SML0_BRAPC|nr:hypothetical protein BpHYR1_025934 [Brachionus plicatilis]